MSQNSESYEYEPEGLSLEAFLADVSMAYDDEQEAAIEHELFEAKLLEDIAALKTALYAEPGVITETYETELNAIDAAMGSERTYENMPPLFERVLSRVVSYLYVERWNQPDDARVSVHAKLDLAAEIIDMLPHSIDIAPFMTAIDLSAPSEINVQHMTRHDVDLQNMIHNPTRHIDKWFDDYLASAVRYLKPYVVQAVVSKLVPGEDDRKKSIAVATTSAVANQALYDAFRYIQLQKDTLAPEAEAYLAKKLQNASLASRMLLRQHISEEDCEKLAQYRADERPKALLFVLGMMGISMPDESES